MFTMKSLCSVSLKTVVRVLCMTGLLILLVCHVATLIFAAVHDDGEHGEQLVIGGLVLCSVLPLLALSRLLPEYAEVFRRAWLTLHLTCNDDLARQAVLALYDLQVKPVVHALGLASFVTGLDTLDYWWWSLQGLLLMVLAGRVLGSGDESESEDEE